jgi:hypothetical protein
MDRRAFARHRTCAALLLGLSLRAPSASAEPAEPDETRVGTVEGKAAEKLPSALETPAIPAAPTVAPRLIRDEGVAYPEQALGDRFYERVEVRLILELDASGHVRSSSVETPQGHGVDAEATGAPRELSGAPPGDVGYFLDRVRVPYLYPSVIPLASIERAGLYPGGYPARFGCFAGGVLSAQTRGPEPDLSGEADLRLVDVGGLIEAPFARGRGGLLPALLSLLSPEVKLDYRDNQAQATDEPSARDRFSVFRFGSYDLPGEKRNGILTRLGDACRPRITFTW